MVEHGDSVAVVPCVSALAEDEVEDVDQACEEVDVVPDQESGSSDQLKFLVLV